MTYLKRSQKVNLSGNLPTVLWSKNGEAKNFARSNSLFEDNAEFDLGFPVSLDNKQAKFAAELLNQLRGEISDNLVSELLNAEQKNEADIWEQRERVHYFKPLNTVNKKQTRSL